MRFVQFSYYKTANRNVPCGVMRCGILLLAVRCSYTILQVVLVRFFQFGEHPYTLLQFLSILVPNRPGSITTHKSFFFLNLKK